MPQTSDSIPSLRRGGRLAIAAVLLLTLFAVGFMQAYAAEPGTGIRAKFRGGNRVVIPAGETVPHDLYVAGGTVRIDGRVEGDLTVAGGTVDVSGPVTGDLFVAGGTVNVTGPVGRHLRVGAGDVTVAAPVELDLLAAAGTLRLRSETKVGGDSIFSAGQVDLDGDVAGGVLGQAGTYTRRGQIGGSEDVTVGSDEPATVEPAQSASSWLLDQLQRYVGILLVGVLSLLGARRFVLPAAERLQRRPWPALGVGALGIVGFGPVLLVMLIVVVLLAIPLVMLGLGRIAVVAVLGVVFGSATLTVLFTAVLLFIAATVVGLVVGRWVLERVGQAAPEPYIALALGALILVALTAIPVAGWLVSFAVACLGFGALIGQAWGMRAGGSAGERPPSLSGAA